MREEAIKEKGKRGTTEEGEEDLVRDGREGERERVRWKESEL